MGLLFHSGSVSKRSNAKMLKMIGLENIMVVDERENVSEYLCHFI